MHFTKITQLGNSDGVILASPLLQESSWRRGLKVSVDYVKEADTFVIRRASKASLKPSNSEKEFKAWLKHFLEEDAELLDRLA